MKRHGHPILEDEPDAIAFRQSGKNIKSVLDDRSSTDEERREADWENILFDIEKGFEAHKKIIADIAIQNPAEMTAAEKTMQKGLQLFAEHYVQLWD
jgi:hypothetical protein